MILFMWCRTIPNVHEPDADSVALLESLGLVMLSLFFNWARAGLRIRDIFDGSGPGILILTDLDPDPTFIKKINGTGTFLDWR